jgi:Family of unknown function (DUF6492)
MQPTAGETAMKRMSVITKSYALDFELCADLNRSVLEYSPELVHHHIVVPRSDLKLFGSLTGPRTHIHREADFLPKLFVPVPFTNFTINLSQPFLPVRGWILQQMIKLAAVAASDDDVVLVADSDVEFVRPFSVETFLRGSVVRFYRKPNAIAEQLPRHVAWHRIARALLGQRPADPPYADYISAMLACDPAIVRKMLGQVTANAGHPWTTAITRQLHFSEWTLYGVFVDDVIGAPANSFASDDPLCLAYWDETPLNHNDAVGFLRGVRSTDVAAMISAKSRTPIAIRRKAFAEHRAARASGGG